MGFRFRWSKGIIPGVRLNLSKSGASVSLGRRGFWYTIGSKGTRTTVGIPGTGLSWTEYSPYSKRKSSTRSGESEESYVRYGQSESEASIDSAEINTISAKSTSEIAPIVAVATSRFRFSRLLLLVCLIAFFLGTFFDNREWLILAALGGLIALPIAAITDYYRRTVRVEYDLDAVQKSQFSEILAAFESAQESKRVWHIPSQQFTSDWKRNAGARSIVKRNRIFPRLRRLAGTRSNLKVPSINVGRQTIQFAPDSVFVSSGKLVAVLNYSDVEVRGSSTGFVEHQRVPSDAHVSGHTWRFANKDGGPDRRFINNRQLPVCSYAQVEFNSSEGLNERIIFSNPAATNFAVAIEDSANLTVDAHDIYTSIHFPSKFHSIVIAICGICIALGIGFVAAGDQKLHNAIKQISDGNWQLKNSQNRVDKQPVSAPAIYVQPKTSSPPKKQAPANDPWRAIR
ncbi:MAG: DUF4236 domain-containing protein [Xanthobacteraceae bacterium]|nr:DUF4236 domain-containing protein [Xanthobacteraceae bacterium]